MCMLAIDRCSIIIGGKKPIRDSVFMLLCTNKCYFVYLSHLLKALLQFFAMFPNSRNIYTLIFYYLRPKLTTRVLIGFFFCFI